MASKTLPSVGKRRAFVRNRARDFTLNRSPEKENFLVFNYDDVYFERYAVFLDKVKGSCEYHDLAMDLRHHLEHVLSPYALINNDLYEAMGCTDYTEGIIDDLYGIAGQECADDILEFVVELANDPLKPQGFGQVKDLLVHNPSFFLLDFYPQREDDAMVYVVVSGESE